MKNRKDLTRHLGETWLVPFTVRDDAGQLVDLTSAAISFYFASPAGTVAMTLTVGDGITIDPDQTANRGRAKVTATPSHQVTAGVEWGPHAYQIETTIAGVDAVEEFGRFYVMPTLKPSVSSFTPSLDFSAAQNSGLVPIIAL